MILDGAIIMVMKKEILHLRRNRWVMFSALFMPIILMAVANLAFTGNLKDIPTVIVDKDGSKLSLDLVEAFDKDNTLDIKYSLQDRSHAQDMITKGLAKVAVIIPKGFDINLISGNATLYLIIDGSDPVIAGKALSAIQVITLGLFPKIPVRIDNSILFNPDLRQTDFIAPSILGAILQAFPIIFISMSIAGERERGTIEQLIVSPIRRFNILFGKLLVYLGIGLINAYSMLAVAVYIFKLPFRGSFLLTSLFFLVSLLAILSQGILASSVSKTQLQAVMTLLPTIYVPIFISGTFYPIEAIPSTVQVIAYAFPLTYMNHALRAVILRGVDVTVVASDLAALSLYASILLSTAVVVFKKKLG